MSWLSRLVTQSDADLVARVLRGDVDAYGDLVQRHQDVLYRHVRAMGLDHDASLDLVQDALVKGYTRLRDCRDPERFRSWLFRIARNLCLDYLKDVRRGNVPLSQLPPTDVVAGREPQTELGIALNDGLDRLPESLREAFLLKHDSGYTYDEIADMTDASVSAVKMRVHRAREILRDFMEANDDVTIASA